MRAGTEGGTAGRSSEMNRDVSIDGDARWSENVLSVEFLQSCYTEQLEHDVAPGVDRWTGTT